MFAASVVPEKAVKEAGDDFGTKPVGAGAFKLEEWKRGDRVGLVRNPTIGRTTGSSSTASNGVTSPTTTPAC